MTCPVCADVGFCNSHPKGEVPFSEEFPHVSSCLQMVASYIVVGSVLVVIAAIGGLSAMCWFGGGILLSSLVFLWEAGRNAIAMEARQGGDAEERLHAKHNSAGRKASPNTSPISQGSPE